MRKTKRVVLAACIVVFVLTFSGCTSGMRAGAAVPELPEGIERDNNGIPLIRLYDADNEKIEEIDIESYIMGVVAGEMRNDWPIEALKAQAILARTFTMKFLSSKDSRYEGADISTDIHEAQAYDALAVNDRIRKAVEETHGIVLVSEGDYPHAWFHAHSGGMTELPSKALEYKDDPVYLASRESPEPDDAPETVKNWSAEFTLDEVEAACKAMGVDTGGIDTFTIGEKGASGRAVTFVANGKNVSAPGFRIQIGASKLKSTLIDSLEIRNEKLYVSGRGFGHGVGMSQWGAYGMAKDRKNYRDIISQYYSDIEFVKLWK